jgi:adenylate cyclase
MAWGLGTAVPILGIVAFGVTKLAGADIDATQVVVASLSLAVIALAVGLSAIRLAARGVAEPVEAVARALERVERGDFQTHVPVDDSSEVGLLQAGFNRMVGGLAERERMRDLFGRHVGEDVARAAMEGEVSLGGEVREVGVLFIDVVGSTTLASERPPEEVVSLLNAFFAIVVEVTESHRGLINKFEGDAALCVFGAPTWCEDPAGDALCAARELRDRLREGLPDIEAGIGVSAGQAVAGNVGAERRFEYTVIGDPVNEGARLCELSKGRPEGLLASEAAVDKARSEEARRWALGEEVTLRGRGEATRLATAA